MATKVCSAAFYDMFGYFWNGERSEMYRTEGNCFASSNEKRFFLYRAHYDRTLSFFKNYIIKIEEYIR